MSFVSDIQKLREKNLIPEKKIELFYYLAVLYSETLETKEEFANFITTGLKKLLKKSNEVITQEFEWFAQSTAIYILKKLTKALPQSHPYNDFLFRVERQFHLPFEALCQIIEWISFNDKRALCLTSPIPLSGEKLKQARQVIRSILNHFEQYMEHDPSVGSLKDNLLQHLIQIIKSGDLNGLLEFHDLLVQRCKLNLAWANRDIIKRDIVELHPDEIKFLRLRAIKSESPEKWIKLLILISKLTDQYSIDSDYKKQSLALYSRLLAYCAIQSKFALNNSDTITFELVKSLIREIQNGSGLEEDDDELQADFECSNITAEQFRTIVDDNYKQIATFVESFADVLSNYFNFKAAISCKIEELKRYKAAALMLIDEKLCGNSIKPTSLFTKLAQETVAIIQDPFDAAKESAFLLAHQKLNEDPFLSAIDDLNALTFKHSSFYIQIKLIILRAKTVANKHPEQIPLLTSILKETHEMIMYGNNFPTYTALLQKIEKEPVCKKLFQIMQNIKDKVIGFMKLFQRKPNNSLTLFGGRIREGQEEIIIINKVSVVVTKNEVTHPLTQKEEAVARMSAALKA